MPEQMPIVASLVRGIMEGIGLDHVESWQPHDEQNSRVRLGHRHTTGPQSMVSKEPRSNDSYKLQSPCLLSQVSSSTVDNAVGSDPSKRMWAGGVCFFCRLFMNYHLQSLH